MFINKITSLLLICLVCTVTASKSYGNDFTTYSIGDRYEKGDFIIKNCTIESTCSFYHWPQQHRLHYKINNQDDLLSFAQIDIINNDEPHNVHITTHPTCYNILIESAKKIRGFVKVYHKAPENFAHLLPFLIQHNAQQQNNSTPNE